jgi:polysaccharide export outer membrane protein
MITKYIRLLSILLFGLPLAGCYTEYGPVEVETAPVAPSTASVAATLRPGDKVKITVYGEEGLTGEYDINPAGSIAMPLIGTIRAAGRAPTELGRDIEGRYRRGNFLQDPHVTVVVVQYKPFYVLGEALTPGEYPFRSGLTVHAAVAMAGGFTYRASKSIVLIRHVGEEIWREYPLSEAVPIAPGDVIRIPERYF